MDRIKKVSRLFLGLPVTIIAFIFIGKVFFDNRTVIIDSFSTLNPLLFLLGIFFFIVFFSIKALIWIQILRLRGFTPNPREAIFEYSYSEAKRYIPGSIFAIAGRMNAHSKSIPQKETLKGIGIEALLLVLSAFVMSLPGIFYLLFKSNQTLIPQPFAIGIASILLIGLCVFSIKKKFYSTILRYLNPFLLFLLAWLVYGFGCLFVGLSIHYIDPTYINFILSFYILSWLSGYLLFVTPMGLGIREVALTLCLSFLLPLPITSAIAVLTRIGMVIGELCYIAIVGTISKLRDNSPILKLDPYFLIIVALSSLYLLYFTSFTSMKHETFLSGRFDLGNMSQTVWNTAHGKIFLLTNPDGIQQISRLGVHSDFLLILFAPFYLIWADPRVLLFIQSLTLASGGVFVYLIARKILQDNKLSLLLGASFLLNFWVHEENNFDFHAVVLATGLLLGASYFLLKKKYILFSLFLALSVLTKENVFLIAAMFGLYFVFIEKKRAVGAILAIASFVIFFYLTSVAIPNARGTDHFALSYYAYLGDSPGEVIKNVFLKPGTILSHIFTFSTFQYLHALLIPTGYLALLSPLALVLAAPDLAISILSNNPNLRSYQYHYGALIIPFVYLSTIYGVKFIIKRYNGKYTKRAISYYLLAMMVLSLFLYSPLPGMKDADYRPFKDTQSSKIKDYISIIPENASVSSSNNVGAHLSHRDEIYVIPHAISSADYVVLYGENSLTVSSINNLMYDTLIADEMNNFYLYKKRLQPLRTAPHSL